MGRYGEGNQDVRDLIGSRVVAVEVVDDKQRLKLHLDDDRVATFTVDADCCSHTWIEHLEAPNDLAKGAEVLAVDNLYMDRDEVQGPEDDDTEDEVTKYYQTVIRTTRGDISIEFRNASNGYYGGSLDFTGFSRPF